MKNAATKENLKGSKLNKKEDVSPIHFLQEQVEHYKKESEILLALSDDITKVREKNDLIIIFKQRIKGLFHITHSIVTLINDKEQTYIPFLLDNTGSPIRSHERYKEMVASHFSLNEPFIQAVLAADEPISFVLEEIMDLPGRPSFLRVNYERGVREIMMTKLMKEGRPMGFIHTYTDQIGGFSQEFRDLMKGIAPQLSNAVSNIIKNEEIQNKEREKSFLLDFSSEIATVRTKEELARAVSTAVNKLNQKRGYVIRRINEDDVTMSPYVFDMGEREVDSKILNAIVGSSYPINDGIQNRVLNSLTPVLLNVEKEIQRGIKAEYLNYWKKMGFENFVAVRLRNGETNIGMLLLDIDEINVPLLQGICAQISIAMANIMANEQISKKQDEQDFLLDFSHNISRVRTKQDLQEAIFTVLDRTMSTKLAMLRVIDDDGLHMSAFMYDSTLFEGAKEDFAKLSAEKITIHETYTSQVLASKDGVIFNIKEEIKKNNPFTRLWKTAGVRNTYALPLRVGDKNIGTIWLLADRLSSLLLKGICAQISIAIDNILANEKLFAYKKRLEVENDYLKEQIKTIYFTDIIGSADEMQKVYRLMSLVAESNTTVLVTGETGTGKELIARALHNSSPRRDKLMVKVNCAALPANLIESELFGHERGAFTGAIDRRIGKFELANNSTLFLDEIGELPLEAQAKLLRVIQERELERLGGKQIIKIDVRLIAATNRILEDEVKAGRFRADLYFRLNVFPIQLPPLRNRVEDIEPLTHFFISKYSRNTGRKIRKVSPRVLQQLRSYTWPGNVRELEHLIERSILLTTDGELNEVFIPESTDGDKKTEAFLLNRSLEDVERSYIIETLKRCAGKVSGTGSAAEVLKIPGNTLHSKMKKLGINKGDYFAP